ncbi:hypothetical protein, partial [Alteromonas australica]|uniref:hypothetical protein n=1 Tax=Alteromonas australica TaxID=589873 RepID=UPI0035C7FDE3
RAHNPKVVGSNPAPATTFKPWHLPGLFCLSFFLFYDFFAACYLYVTACLQWLSCQYLVIK